MQDQQTNWRQIWVYAVIALTFVGYGLLFALGETNIFLLGAPALAALVTKLAFQRNLRGLSLTIPGLHWLPIAYLVPVLVTGAAFAIYWAATGNFVAPEGASTFATFLISAGPVFASTAFFAIGEELGWRGFLVSELLKSYKFSSVALITGLLWAIWHWPLIFLSSEVTGLNLVSPWFALPVFTIILTSAGAVLAWFTMKSRSVLPAVILHGAQNAFTHGFFMTVTEQTATSPYFASEAGGLLAVTWALVALYVQRREAAAA